MTSLSLALYVANNVSFSLLQVLPSSDLKILLRLCTFVTIAVKPKILGLLIVKILTSSTKILGSSMYSSVQLVNRVAVDLAGERFRSLAAYIPRNNTDD